MGTVRAQKINKAETARADCAANPSAAANKGSILGLSEDNLRLQKAIEEVIVRVNKLERVL